MNVTAFKPAIYLIMNRFKNKKRNYKKRHMAFVLSMVKEIIKYRYRLLYTA